MEQKIKKIDIELVKQLNELLDMDWTDEDMDGISESYFVHCLSTYIYDCSGRKVKEMEECLSNIRTHFSQYYAPAMEGFLLGKHDI